MTTAAAQLSRWQLYLTVSRRPDGGWKCDMAAGSLGRSRPYARRSVGLIAPGMTALNGFRHLLTYPHGDVGVPEAKRS